MNLYHPPHLSCFLCLVNLSSDIFSPLNPGPLKAPIQSFIKGISHAFFSPLYFSPFDTLSIYYSRKNHNLHFTIFLTESMHVDRTFIFMGDVILFILEGMTDDL